MSVSKISLNNKIEPFIFDQLDRPFYGTCTQPAKALLTWNRFDLAFKLAFLDLRERNFPFAEEVYKQDIRSQTLGGFREFGSVDKDTFEKYKECFLSTYLSIKENGFDSERTLVPISEAGTIINGAHRVASAIHLNQALDCVETALSPMDCGFRYFFERNVPEYILDFVATKFIEYADNVYIAFLWPSGKDKKAEAELCFDRVVYKKNIRLTTSGALNLIFELYKHMDWLGDKTNQFSGVQKKLLECFPSFDDVTVIAFQSDDISSVRAIKERVRDINGIGFSSIHITDTKQEAVDISALVFSENGVHFLNHAKPLKYDYAPVLDLFGEFLERNKVCPGDVVIDGGFVLSIYGLRKSRDLDFISFYDISAADSQFDCHDDEIRFHLRQKCDLIYDPQYFFQYRGFKFVSFQQIYNMKKQRNDQKDVNDCLLMKSLVEDDRLAAFVITVKQSFYYSRIKLRKASRDYAMMVLRKLGLYNMVRNIYRSIRAKAP